MKAAQLSGLQQAALLESERLVEQLPQDKLNGIDILLVPTLLAYYGLLTIPRILSVLSRCARIFGLDALADVLITFRGVVVGRRVLEQVLKYYPVSTVIVADDRSLGWEYGVVLEARRRGIQTVAVPFALSDPEADCLSRQNNKKFNPNVGWGFERYLKRRMYVLYPKNIWSGNGGEKMFFTSGQAWALMKLGGQLEQPWTFGGGITDLVTVFGDFDYRKLVDSGVSPSKIFITGQSSVDTLYGISRNSSEVRNSLIQHYNLSKKLPIIICAMPQYLEHGLLSAKDHWYLVEQLLKSLSTVKASIVLSLHPRSKLTDYKNIAKTYNAAIATQPLITIMAGADLFVSAMSSTVRWAILLRTPTIVLDDLKQFRQSVIPVKGVQFVRQRNHLAQLAEKLLFDESERQGIIRSLNHEAFDLDPFDGLNSNRLINLLKRR
jgi:hypothetical protein